MMINHPIFKLMARVKHPQFCSLYEYPGRRVWATTASRSYRAKVEHWHTEDSWETEGKLLYRVNVYPKASYLARTWQGRER